MVRKRVSSIEISIFAHATEDPEKVKRAFQNILPPNKIEEVILHKSVLRGDYGNPIIYYRARITKPEITEALLRRIGNNLPLHDKRALSSEFGRRLDRGKLFIRLDKQAAYMERYRLCNTDPIHLKIRFKTSKINEIKQICRELGMLP